MEIESIRVERLYLKVAKQLSQQISDGNIQSGERLPSERDLASSFGVSRPTIREAMIALEIADMIEIRSGSGIYVRSVASKDGDELPDDAPGPLELLEARYHFEGDAAALAAKRASKAEIAEMEQALAERESENRQAESHESADEIFHLSIAAATRNSAIHAAIRRLWELRKMTEMSIFFHEKLRSQGIKPVIRDHRAILEAIKKRDPNGARAAMQSHLKRVIDAIVEDGDDSSI